MSPRRCSPCTKIDFDCKTSDKLSRRAFPRNYTESLEERVRSLEAEVKSLKDLLDRKDEQLDMISRIQSHSTARAAHSPTSNASTSNTPPPEPGDTYKLIQSPLLLSDGLNSYFLGTSSTKYLIGMIADV